MSYFEQLIPSMLHYFKKFKRIDETDLEIIFTMVADPDGPRNVRKMAQKLNLPQQTANYRVLRFEHLDLVRFRAIVDEASLGLTNYAVIATVRPGLVYENKQGTAINAGTFMTCYPVWRLLEDVHGGATHGFFVLYSIPPQRENDLRLFLDKLDEIGCIERVDKFCEVTRSHFNLPSLDLYRDIIKTLAKNHQISFDWEKWADDFDKAEEAPPPEEIPPKRKFSFSYEDLVLLFQLERNLREKFVNIARSVGAPSARIAKRYRDITRHGLIKGCRVELYPVDPVHSLHLLLQLTLTDDVVLRKLVSHLNDIPYPVTYQKIVRENVLLLHTMIPAYEYLDFRNAFEIWGRRSEIVRDFRLYISSYYSKFDNIKLYDAFSREENKWMISKEKMLEALRRLIDNTKFKF